MARDSSGLSSCPLSFVTRTANLLGRGIGKQEPVLLSLPSKFLDVLDLVPRKEVADRLEERKRNVLVQEQLQGDPLRRLVSAAHHVDEICE